MSEQTTHQPTAGSEDNLGRLAAIAGEIVSTFHPPSMRDEKRGLGMEVEGEGFMVRLLNPIEAEAPTLEATTARGALFQLLLAAGDLGCLVGTTDWSEGRLLKVHQRIEGCVLSAINVFERECGLKREDIGGEYYARRDYVPEVWEEHRKASQAT